MRGVESVLFRRLRALTGRGRFRRDSRRLAFYTDPTYRHHSLQISNYGIVTNMFFHIRRLLHNHPSGDPSPSPADIDMTRTIVETAKPLGVVVHDHIIVGKNGHASLKGMQLI